MGYEMVATENNGVFVITADHSSVQLHSAVNKHIKNNWYLTCITISDIFIADKITKQLKVIACKILFHC